MREMMRGKKEIIGKVLFLAFCSMLLTGLLMPVSAADDSPLAYGGYGGLGSPGRIVISARMMGPSFTLSSTQWRLGRIETVTPYVMERGLIIRNTGGVILDFSIYSLPTIGGWDLHVGDASPAENAFSLYALAGALRDTLRVPSELQFSRPSPVRNQLNYFPLEITSDRFYNSTWSTIPSIMPLGIHLPGRVPTDPDGNAFSLFLKLLSPSRSTVDSFQTIEVYIEANLFD